jgi:hypothetical protein
MSKEKGVTMVNEYTQTDILNTTTSSKGSPHSPNRNESSEGEKVIQSVNAHDKAYNYLESLEKKYSNDLDKIYDYAGQMMDAVREAGSFSEGLKEAINKYKAEIKSQDKENFILVQFLEEFYGGTVLVGNYNQEVHERNFKDALLLADSAIDDAQFLGDIYYNFDSI